MSTPDKQPLISLSGICRSYPGVLANDNVSLTINKGEIHGLIGENGAGKSTLVKIMYGSVRPDSGRIVFNGDEVSIDNPAFARRLGIAMVFQHFSLFEPMTVLENVALGLAGQSADAALAGRLVETGERYGMPVDADRTVDELSVGERQRIEILRCLLQDPELLIMDEPTSVLTPQESNALFVTLRKIAEEGRSILFISHKLDEVRALCETSTVMRGGKVVAQCDPREESAATLAKLMVGEDLAEVERPPRSASGAPIFEINDLNVPAPYPGASALQSISFAVSPGEIFGVAGVAGNGQAELLAALSGETRSARSSVTVNGESCGHEGPRARRSRGIGFVPEDRLGHGAVPDFALTENAFLTGHITEPLIRSAMIDHARTRTFAEKIRATFDVRAASVETLAGQLSGGNLQKFILGREILLNPRVLVVAHPTWGVDAGAAVLIRSRLVELAQTGAAVVVVSQDLDELLQISHRISVLTSGTLSGSMATADVTAEELGLLMMETDGGQYAHTA